MPGSVAFYLWEPMGISFKNLITKLIELGIKGSEEYRKNIYTFDTALLDKVSLGGAKGAKGAKIAK
jgi:D-alanine-D-alanine ligase